MGILLSLLKACASAIGYLANPIAVFLLWEMTRLVFPLQQEKKVSKGDLPCVGLWERTMSKTEADLAVSLPYVCKAVIFNRCATRNFKICNT